MGEWRRVGPHGHPRSGGPKGGGPKGGGPTFRAFFSLSRHNFLSFLLSLGVFSWNFGGVFERRDPQMCTFGLSDCRVKTRRLGVRGSTHENLEHRNTTKIPREDPKKRKKIVAGEGEKKSEILGGPGEGRSWEGRFSGAPNMTKPKP